MKSETNKKDMDKFFHVNHQEPNISCRVNKTFLTMTTDAMIKSIHNFGLDPVYAYLDFTQVRDQNSTWDIRGFVTYIDNYLIETSGGERTKLKELGCQIMGKQPNAFSTRMIRMELISFILSQQIK